MAVQKLKDIDFSSIEAGILAWLQSQTILRDTSVNNDRRLHTMCGCSKTKYADNSLAKVIEEMIKGFDDAYEEASSKGFPETGLIKADSRMFVVPLLQRIKADYGNIALGTDFRLVSAVRVLEGLNDAFIGLESLRSLTGEDEKKGEDETPEIMRTLIAAQAATLRETLGWQPADTVAA